ncbi:MAG TPA: glycoside hydrolase family 16 protein, partial [Cryomorphaceae bacterium]|nr:glycoside hydrolase family 16 protein [Cryomorphaceae bacterium]
MKVYTLFLIALFSATSLISTGQEIILEDDFESSDSNLNWQAFDVNAVFGVSNPYSTEQNTSEGVMSYSDFGALYGNVSFDTSVNFDLTDNSTFSLKIYIPSDELTGDQENQISLKLQNANLDQPWQTQCEIIKPLLLDQWQTVSFDFSTDDYINLNNSSPAPTDRFDFNRVLLQVNGENNTDQVMAFIDDFAYDGVLDLDANPTNSIYTNLVWADEFETDGAINSEKWFHQTLLPNGWGWFNNEQQHYTDRIENSFVDDGNLHIVAKSETFSDQGVTKDYTSARLNSKFAFTYGRVVARAILPEGAGTWPAIWMLGKNINENGGYWQEEFGTTGWPECGEIDIMEHWGNNQNVVSAALHTPSSFGATENYGTIFDD